MSAGLRKRELRLHGDLNERVNTFVGHAMELRNYKAPGRVAEHVADLLREAVWIMETAGKLCEAIRVQHPAPGTGP